MLFGRKLPSSNIPWAFALITLYLCFLGFAFSLFLHVEKTPFVATLFEATSAMGTVGLSLGLTGFLGMYGKLILTLCMFTGRVGPAVLMVILLRRKTTSHADYPEEKIILG
ncbi:MAG: potassium transporter TrkG [Pseudomonadota bacterium]